MEEERRDWESKREGETEIDEREEVDAEEEEGMGRERSVKALSGSERAGGGVVGGLDSGTEEEEDAGDSAAAVSNNAARGIVSPSDSSADSGGKRSPLQACLSYPVPHTTASYVSTRSSLVIGLKRTSSIAPDEVGRASRISV